MQKRGQLTIFIIVGIILLILIGLFFWLKYATTYFTPEKVLPQEVVPVRNFIKSCVETLAVDALDRIGTTGGYVNVPRELSSDPTGYLRLSPIENVINPYWFHNSELRIPTEEFIANEVNTHIASNLKECINNLEDFKNQFNIVELGNISVNTIFGYESTAIDVKYPLDISDKVGKKITQLEDFSLNLPIRFKTVYEAAKEIMNTENQNMKIEQIVMDLIAIDPDLPYIGSEFSCKRKTWKIPEVTKKIKELLRYNIPEIRINKIPHTAIPSENEYMKNHFVWDATASTYRNIRASFSFDEKWPFYIYIRPHDGNKLESGMQQGTDIISWLCIQTWKFTYDIQFPVMATIKDDKSGYRFSFSFPVLIDHNQGSRHVSGSMSFNFARIPDTEEYCSTKNIRTTILSYASIQSDSGEEHEELSGVNLTYTCLKHSCYIGTTKWTSGGAVASYTGNFPYCAQGILKGEKEGYKQGISVIATESPAEHYIYLTPIKKIVKYSVMKHPIENLNTYEFLASNEEASITMEKGEHKTYGAYPSDVEVPIEFLARGDNTYNLKIYLASGDSIKGGYLANWTVPWEKLKESDEIVFHVAYKSSFANEDEEFAFWKGLSDYSRQLPQPELRVRKE